MIETRNEPDFDIDQVVTAMRDNNRLVMTAEGPYSIVQDDGVPTTDCSKHSLHFDWHTDGLVYPTPPKYVMLHCVNPGTEGITTELCDVNAALDKLPISIRQVLYLCRSNYVDRRGDAHPLPLLADNGLYLASRGFIDSIVPVEYYPTIRGQATSLNSLIEALDNNICHTQNWKAGDTLIFNNHKYLHRRVSKGLDKQRKLYRLWFN